MKHLNRRGIAASCGVLCMMCVGIFDATRAQQPPMGTISVDMQQVMFSNVASGSAANQTIHVTLSVNGTFTVNTAGAAAWLSVSPAGTVHANAGSPVPLLLTVSTNGPPQLGPGTYETEFTISTGNNSNITQVMVTMTVGGITVLRAAPTIVNFTATPGALEASPATLPLTVSVAGGNELVFSVHPKRRQLADPVRHIRLGISGESSDSDDRR